MPDQPVEQWPTTPPPERIVAAEALEQLRNSLRQRIDFAVQVLGIRPSLIALSARLSEKGLAGYDKVSWNPTPGTMTQVDQVLTDYLPTWIEEARRRRDGENEGGIEDARPR